MLYIYVYIGEGNVGVGITSCKARAKHKVSCVNAHITIKNCVDPMVSIPHQCDTCMNMISHVLTFPHVYSCGIFHVITLLHGNEKLCLWRWPINPSNFW